MILFPACDTNVSSSAGNEVMPPNENLNKMHFLCGLPVLSFFIIIISYQIRGKCFTFRWPVNHVTNCMRTDAFHKTIRQEMRWGDDEGRAQKIELSCLCHKLMESLYTMCCLLRHREKCEAFNYVFIPLNTVLCSLRAAGWPFVPFPKALIMSIRNPTHPTRPLFLHFFTNWVTRWRSHLGRSLTRQNSLGIFHIFALLSEGILWPLLCILDSTSRERGRDLICWRLPPISFKRLLIDNGKGERWTLNRHSNYRL